MVEGDVAKKYLGMQESDWKMLQECVTLVFNAAASVRFDDPLQKAIFTNTRSTKDAILLAKGMKNLKVSIDDGAYKEKSHAKFGTELQQFKRIFIIFLHMEMKF